MWCACAWGIRNRLHTAVGVALVDVGVPWVIELWCACAWGIRNRIHAAVGMALGDEVVVRMRLRNKKQATHSCGRGPG